MVTPVTGPFTRSETILGPPVIYAGNKRYVQLTYSRTSYRQRRPYSVPLPFSYKRNHQLSSEGDGALYEGEDANLDNSSWVSPDPSTTEPNTYNRAYGRFISELSPTKAGLGINFVQRKQAIDMIAARGSQLASFVRNLGKRKLSRAWKSLKVQSPPPVNWRRGNKSVADLFLEGWFGWAPLVGDIYACIELLQSGVPPSRVKGKAAVDRKHSYTTVLSSSPIWSYSVAEKTIWQINADVRVSNPNLWLANQLGLVNPAVVALDSVPFSFVLNWFVNVSEFLSQFTDTWGLEIINPSITLHRVVDTTKRKYFRTGSYWVYPRQNPYMKYRYRRVQTDRKTGSIPGPTLRVRSPWVLSPTRGAVSVALLVQQMHKFRP